jgi:hypothetical protein
MTASAKTELYPTRATRWAGQTISPEASKFLFDGGAVYEVVVEKEAFLLTQIERVRKIRLFCANPDRSYEITEIDARLAVQLVRDFNRNGS